MNKSNTFVIEDGSTKLGETLGLKSVEFTPNLLTDDAIDEWLTTTVFGINSNIEKLIIPVRLGNDDAEYLGLRVDLHIRLTKNRFNERFRFIPLIFASVGETKEFILSNQIERNSLLSALLLFTKGCTIVDFFDLVEAINDFHEIIGKDISQSDLLKKLVISDERLQSHQLANEWGVFRLAKFAGKELSTIQQPKDLYFKYRFSLSDLEIDSKDKNKTNVQDNNNCNYLLIDDNGFKGWEELLTHIIESEIINKFTKKAISRTLTTFEEADNYEEYESHDLIFLDLRLTKEEDNPKNLIPIENYSGVKLLKKIKKINKGLQVIILTASNKAWNMKTLLDAGADAYFIKESPEIPVSDDSSKANYDNLVEAIKKAFKRRYLRDIFQEIKTLHQKLDTLSTSNSYSSDFLNELKNQLSIAFDMHYNAKSKEQFAYAYVSLYMIIETINNQFVAKSFNDDWMVNITNTPLLDWHFDTITKLYINTNTTVRGNKPPEWQKLSGLYFQNWNGQETSFIQKTYHLITKRNGFIHNDKSILDKTKKDINGKDILDKEKKPIYLNHDIYEHIGFIELFEVIQKVIGYLG